MEAVRPHKPEEVSSNLTPAGSAGAAIYLLKECPRCHGDVVVEREIMGRELMVTVKCLSCGWRE